MWPDNKPPCTKEEGNTEIAFLRIKYIIEKIEKHRLKNPTGCVVVHCR
jgi:hypothetical protein